MAENGDHSLDLVGAGKLANAIPAKAWERLVETACETLKECLAPITATTGGLGRLIQARFDRLVDAQKVLAAEAVSRANKKVTQKPGRDRTMPKAPVVLAAIEASSVETDETLRELWANLLAQEFIHGNVHPEFVRVLSRLSTRDAQVLAMIARAGKRTLNSVKVNIFVKSLIHIGVLGVEENSNFSLELLANLNLIQREDGLWNLTATGHAFIEAVSDPSLA